MVKLFHTILISIDFAQYEKSDAQVYSFKQWL